MPEWVVEAKGFKAEMNKDGVNSSEVAEHMCETLRAAVARKPKFAGEDTPYALEEMEDLLEELTDAAAEDDLDWFNGVLEGIYQWANGYRVWLGI